jgi:hypothetical protein
MAEHAVCTCHDRWADITTLRDEIATFRGELKLDILRVGNKLDHYAATQASHSESIRRPENRG